MKKLYLILVILAIAVSSICSQTTSNTAISSDSRVMIVNAYSREIYIQLITRKSDFSLETGVLVPNDFSDMYNVPKNSFLLVKYKYHEADNWMSYYDEDADDYMVYIPSGIVYCIEITGDGQYDEHILALPDSALPRVCFYNLSNTQLSRMEIGTDYMYNFAAFTTDIKSMGLTNFTTVNAGSYGLSWATVASAALDKYTWLSDDNDYLKLFKFENYNIYVFCVINYDASNAILYNITP